MGWRQESYPLDKPALTTGPKIKNPHSPTRKVKMFFSGCLCRTCTRLIEDTHVFEGVQQCIDCGQWYADYTEACSSRKCWCFCCTSHTNYWKAWAAIAGNGQHTTTSLLVCTTDHVNPCSNTIQVPSYNNITCTLSTCTGTSKVMSRLSQLQFINEYNKVANKLDDFSLGILPSHQDVALFHMNNATHGCA